MQGLGGAHLRRVGRGRRNVETKIGGDIDQPRLTRRKHQRRMADALPGNGVQQRIQQLPRQALFAQVAADDDRAFGE